MTINGEAREITSDLTSTVDVGQEDIKDQMAEEGWSDGTCGCPQVKRGKRPDGAKRPDRHDQDMANREQSCHVSDRHCEENSEF
ncbi:uncharacterized protein LOC126383654 isoform X3 [Epinephelus moara]|uniref:uncharacterized protein LOC126383654 isoform X3 n=1 Tax=Epinephelus moara TaxID=300413 RepID=UPI00214F1077|nr:uncharacterized protein LOC126383654 isoform X3 [Epinephelus moara]